MNLSIITLCSYFLPLRLYGSPSGLYPFHYKKREKIKLKKKKRQRKDPSEKIKKETHRKEEVCNPNPRFQSLILSPDSSILIFNKKLDDFSHKFSDFQHQITHSLIFKSRWEEWEKNISAEFDFFRRDRKFSDLRRYFKVCFGVISWDLRFWKNRFVSYYIFEQELCLILFLTFFICFCKQLDFWGFIEVTETLDVPMIVVWCSTL